MKVVALLVGTAAMGGAFLQMTPPPTLILRHAAQTTAHRKINIPEATKLSIQDQVCILVYEFLVRCLSTLGNMNGEYMNGQRDAKQIQQSNAERLHHILNEPTLRSLFREFLKGNFCEENLSFWIDVQDFKKKFTTTSSANSAATSKLMKANTIGQVAMEQHNQSLINAAFAIYNNYLAPSSHCELNIDHALRNELINYLTDVMTGLTGKTFTGYVDPELAKDVTATQLQHMIRVYERIQAHVFRLMATDSVPKVC